MNHITNDYGQEVPAVGYEGSLARVHQATQQSELRQKWFIDSVKFLDLTFRNRRCDSDGVSDCIRCNVMVLVNTLLPIIDSQQNCGEKGEK